MRTAVDLTPEQRERNEALAKALESGEYIQGRSKLKSCWGVNGDRFCCIGVACDLHAKASLGHWESSLYVVEQRGAGPDYSSMAVAPVPVRDWYGWDDTNPKLLTEEGLSSSGVMMNDDTGADFKAIAAAFRRTYVELPFERPASEDN